MDNWPLMMFCSLCNRVSLGLALTAVTIALAFGGEENGAPAPHRAANLQTVTEWTAEMRAAHGDDPDRMVRRGLVADRRTRRIHVRAEATGIQSDAAVEFVLIAERSGHDYEALAVAFAEPSDIHAALEFIGVSPGLAADPAQLRFRPRGERIKMTFRWRLPDDQPDHAPVFMEMDAETLLYDLRGRTPPPVEGFVFTGSARREHPVTGEPVYAADVFGPHSIVSLYNEPLSVLDVPRAAPQRDVYGSLVPDPDHLLPEGTLLDVLLEPADPPDRPRVFSARLRIMPTRMENGPTATELCFSIEHDRVDELAPPLKDADLFEFLAWLGRLTESGRDAFLVPVPDADLAWGKVREFYRILETLEAGDSLSVDPPPDDRLYFRSLLPAEWFRDRESRPAHPDELHLRLPHPEAGDATGDQGYAVWQRFEETWADDDAAAVPDLNVMAIPVDNPAALREHHRRLAYRPVPAVILVFAPLSTPLSTLHAWIVPLRDLYPTQYVFEPSESTEAAGRQTESDRPTGLEMESGR